MTTTNPPTPQSGGGAASVAAVAPVLATFQGRQRRSIGYHAWAFIASKPLGAVGLIIILFMAFLAIAAPLVAPKNPNKISAYETLEPPGSNYVLGSDRRGRDVASRVIYGARMSLLVGFSSVALGCAAGFILAVTTGYIGKWPDMAASVSCGRASGVPVPDPGDRDSGGARREHSEHHHGHQHRLRTMDGTNSPVNGADPEGA